MFGFFKRKASNHSVLKDIVWLTEEIKFSKLTAEANANPNLLIVCWFDETYEKLERLLSSSEQIALAATLQKAHLLNKKIIFAEHYPVLSKEKSLFHQLNIQETIVYSAINEPLFVHFGGERLTQLIKMLGIKEDESITHSMVSSSIARAQQKIEQQMKADYTARSQAGWMNKNLPTQKK